jgi:DNA-binding LacI/PurR family transcriptional regulator
LASYQTVLAALRDLAYKLEDGARLPTVRDLMKRHKVSQATVQQAFAELKREGLLVSQVGRGTYLRRPGEGEPPPASPRPVDDLSTLLMLSSSRMNERCVLVQNQIVSSLTGEGARIVQMSWHDTDHLMQILHSVPRFDAAILQSHYDVIPIRLLALLREKTRAVVVDGHSLAGIDVDRVGTDWEEAVELALAELTRLGHRRVGLVTIDSPAQPILAVRRAFARLDNWRGTGLVPHPPVVLSGIANPTLQVADALSQTLSGLRGPDGALPFTALLTLGISDGAGIREALSRLGLDGPDCPSVFVLGHHDVPSEHFGTLAIAGSSHVEASAALLDTIRQRIASPLAPPRVTFLACAATLRPSIRPQLAPAPGPARAAAARARSA